MRSKKGGIDPLLLILLGVGGYMLFARSGAAQGRTPTLPAISIRPSTSTRMKSNSDNSYIKWVQSSLNQLMGCGLAVDGIMGPLTSGCVKRFQAMWGINTDGIVGPETDYYIRSALGMPGYIDQPYGGIDSKNIVTDGWW